MFPVQVRHTVLIAYCLCLQGLLRYAYDLDKNKEYLAGTVFNTVIEKYSLMLT
jgi:hypothetical protein